MAGSQSPATQHQSSLASSDSAHSVAVDAAAQMRVTAIMTLGGYLSGSGVIAENGSEVKRGNNQNDEAE